MQSNDYSRYLGDISGAIFSTIVWIFFGLLTIIVAQIFLLPLTFLVKDSLKRMTQPTRPQLLQIVLSLINFLLGIIFLRLAVQNIHNSISFRTNGDIYLQIAALIDVVFLINRYINRVKKVS